MLIARFCPRICGRRHGFGVRNRNVLFFNNRMGCAASLLISAVVTLFLFVACGGLKFLGAKLRGFRRLMGGYGLIEPIDALPELIGRE